ncbi:hypothetical protein B0H16DRAFT_1578243 [Mycena metata]|uniref:TPR-like protein n=1 Tax=Mycena metata TaxID=1033252 RepID=A0AAD7I4S9_9AGAR|nr:hypothetical protein B0H16DRAFT_1578243 [Mycena metata]
MPTLRPSKTVVSLRFFSGKAKRANYSTDCKAGLQQGLDFFQVMNLSLANDIGQIQRDVERRHQEVMQMLESLSETDGASSVNRVFSTAQSSVNSISMLPSEPKIFHGRETELSDILALFRQGTPRIAILGAGGMGKTSLARAVLHSTEITDKYQQQRFFATKIELAATIGAHLGLKPGKDLTLPVINHLSSSPPTLLVLDNLETLIEEFLSLLTGVEHLALLITMRGVERPAKIQWTRPFIPALKPLSQEAARQMFIDVADETHDLIQMDQILLLANNIPLAIDLLAHAVESDGCATVLARWEEEKTSVISKGNDRKSNLDLSISLSLSSPPILPDGLPMSSCCKASFRWTISSAARRPMNGNESEPWCPFGSTWSNFTHPACILFGLSCTTSRNLVLSIYGTCDLNRFTLAIGRKKIALMDEINGVLPQPCDHRLEAHFIGQIITYVEIRNLIEEGLQHLEYFDDPDLKCKFYSNLAAYELEYIGDGSKAANYAQTGLEFAISSGMADRQSSLLLTLAWTKWRIGDYRQSRTLASEARRLAGLCADLFNEAQALHLEASCLRLWGNYKESITLCNQALELSALCGTSGGSLDRLIWNSLAETHRHKSEYLDAREMNNRILQASSDEDQLSYGVALINIAEIDIRIGAPAASVQKEVDAVISIFTTLHSEEGIAMCTSIMGDLRLREGHLLEAKALFQRSIASSWGRGTEILGHCLERLGDAVRWDDGSRMPNMTIIFLVHSLKLNEKLPIHKALQFLGDVFLAEGSEETARSLFTIALEGFRYMDVHEGKAECLLRLGNISYGHQDFSRALELWGDAKQLFERLSRGDEITYIDGRMDGAATQLLQQDAVAPEVVISQAPGLRVRVEW